MKQITTVLIGLMSIFSVKNASGQIQKGNVMVGAGLANLGLGLQKGASIGLDLHPRIGYFFADNLALGALVNLGFDYAKSQGTNIN